jgi:hypothetical protein
MARRTWRRLNGACGCREGRGGGKGGEGRGGGGGGGGGNSGGGKWRGSVRACACVCMHLARKVEIMREIMAAPTRRALGRTSQKKSSCASRSECSEDPRISSLSLARSLALSLYLSISLLNRQIERISFSDPRGQRSRASTPSLSLSLPLSPGVPGFERRRA